MLSRIFLKTINVVPIWFALRFCGLVSFFLGETLKFRLLGNMLATSSRGNRVHYSGTPRRGLGYLTNGLRKRGGMLAEQYLLQNIGFDPKNVVDVGANSGDLLLAFQYPLENYVAIEPILDEFEALSRNCENRAKHTPLNLALAATSGEVEIFVSMRGGDSSIIRPANGYTEKRMVKAKSLDDLFREGYFSEFGLVDLLKVEAEGYEPEILSGASEFLKMCLWVSIDGGPERGLDSSTTVEACANFMIKNGFRMTALNLKSRPGVCLFRNENLL